MKTLRRTSLCKLGIQSVNIRINIKTMWYHCSSEQISDIYTYSWFVDMSYMNDGYNNIISKTISKDYGYSDDILQ